MIVDLLQSAQHSIVLNMYGYDDTEADGAIRAKADEAHISVQMSLDKSQAGGVHEAQLLKTWNADAFATSIAIGTSSRHAISHLKVLIVDGVYTVSGSTNWSMAGEEQQDNQITISKNSAFAGQCRAILDCNHAFMLKQVAGDPKALALAAKLTGSAKHQLVRLTPIGKELAEDALATLLDTQAASLERSNRRSRSTWPTCSAPSS